MRKKQVWRYYCDFCKKASCSAGALKSHERSCTANPNRVCRMCEKGEYTPAPLPELIKVFEGIGRPTDMEDIYHFKSDVLESPVRRLRELADGCPCCIFAAIRQAGFAPVSTFKLKDEIKSVWPDINDTQNAREHGY
jgi:hypothetical protein